MTELVPATPGWDRHRERVIETEDRAVKAVNKARDELLRQGDLFAQITEGPLVAQMARECGIGLAAVYLRRDLAAKVGPRMRQRLAEVADVAVSWEALLEIMHAPDPEVWLTRGVKRVRAFAATRLPADDVRRLRGQGRALVGDPR